MPNASTHFIARANTEPCYTTSALRHKQGAKLSGQVIVGKP